MVIKYYIKHVYGSPRIYPANPAAETLAKIAGTITLKYSDLHNAKLLGLEVEEVHPFTLEEK